MKVLASILIFLLIASFSDAKDKVNLSDVPQFNISTLVKHHKENLIFKTQAYVVYKYACPHCPEGTQCKPCMGDNVVISEADGKFENYNDLNSSRMIVYLPNPGQDK